MPSAVQCFFPNNSQINKQINPYCFAHQGTIILATDYIKRHSNLVHVGCRYVGTEILIRSPPT